VEALSADKISVVDSMYAISAPCKSRLTCLVLYSLVQSKPSEAEISLCARISFMSVTTPPVDTSMGTWFGWHWSETSSPFLALTRINFEPGDAESDSETEVVLSGDGVGRYSY
jgi:hypothetical protein